MTTLREAAHSLYDHFGCGHDIHPYIQGIGEGAGAIHVYLVREPMGHEKPVPETWEGFPVESRVVGRITIGGGR